MDREAENPLLNTTLIITHHTYVAPTTKPEKKTMPLLTPTVDDSLTLTHSKMTPTRQIGDKIFSNHHSASPSSN